MTISADTGACALRVVTRTAGRSFASRTAEAAVPTWDWDELITYNAGSSTRGRV
jgi:hypothetical protein